MLRAACSRVFVVHPHMFQSLACAADHRIDTHAHAGPKLSSLERNASTASRCLRICACSQKAQGCGSRRVMQHGQQLLGAGMLSTSCRMQLYVAAFCVVQCLSYSHSTQCLTCGLFSGGGHACMRVFAGHVIDAVHTGTWTCLQARWAGWGLQSLHDGLACAWVMS
jgi:hypothetical protein